jgi:subtilase family serine protease
MRSRVVAPVLGVVLAMVLASPTVARAGDVGPGLADLVPVKMQIKALDRNCPQASATIQVRNQGRSDAPTFVVVLQAWVNTGQFVWGKWVHHGPPVPARSSVTVRIHFSVSSGYSMTVRVDVDHNDQILESNELNNSIQGGALCSA